MCFSIFVLLSVLSATVAQQVPFDTSRSDPGHPFSGGIITPRFNAQIKEWMEESGVKGLTLGIVHLDEDNEYGAWGIKTEDGEPVIPETVFNIGSCSKAFVASSVGLLMEDYARGANTTPLPSGVDAFNWGTKLRDILPGEWQLKDEWSNEKVNVRDILTHVSGLTRHDLAYSREETPAEMIHRMRYLEPNWELREQWHYNNQMFTTAGYIIDKYTGSYEDYIQTKIWDSLNMSSTTFWPKAPALSQTWASNGRRIPYWLDETSAMHLIEGAGGISSNVVDMSKWIEMHLKSGVNPVTGEHVLPHSVFEATTSAHSVVNDSPEQPTITYGLGWMQTTILGQKVITHGGAIPGFKTFVAFLPDSGIGFVSLTNTDSGLQVQSRIAADIVATIALSGPSLEGREAALNDFSPMVSPPKKTASSKLVAQESKEPCLALSNYTGTYDHPAYGAFTLCDSSSSSFYCVNVLSEFNAVDSVESEITENTAKNQLLAKWPRFWTSHLRLTHKQGHIFQYQPTYLFTEGYGADKTPFGIGSDEGGLAEFVLDKEGKVVGLKLIDELDQYVQGRENELQTVLFSKVY